MTVLWVAAGAALVVAAAAWISARRSAVRLTQLSDMYWELKYQHLELRKELERRPGADAPPARPPAAAAQPASPPPRESFVPLTSLRR